MADLYDVIKGVVDSVEKGDGIPPVDESTTEVVEGEEGNEGVEADAGGEEGSEGDGSGVGEESDSGEEGTDGEGDSDGSGEAAEGAEGEGAKELKLEGDETDKLLESLGVRTPKEGERENRLPHSRVRKIVYNGVKQATEKLKAEHTADLQRRAAQAQPLVNKANEWDKFNGLMREDPEKFMGLLAATYPQYKRFLEPAKPASPPPDEKGPQADIRLDDGSMTYSPEQWAKRESWVIERATALAEERLAKKYDERITPFEKEAAARKFNEGQIGRIQEQVARAEQQWGELFREDYKKGNSSDVLKYMKEMQQAGTPVPFEYAVTHVLLPRLQVSRDQMRSEVLKEFNERKKAARKPVAAGSGQSQSVVRSNVAAEPPEGVDGVTFAIQQSIKRAGLK